MSLKLLFLSSLSSGIIIKESLIAEEEEVDFE